MFAIVACLVAAAASLMRGGKFHASDSPIAADDGQAQADANGASASTGAGSGNGAATRNDGSLSGDETVHGNGPTPGSAENTIIPTPTREEQHAS